MQRSLVDAVICPHCWHAYPPEDSLWVSSDHPSLQGDSVADPDGARGLTRRFPASRFDVTGNAIDASGAVCRSFACPRCHLEVPDLLYETPPFFMSIVGAPGSGKSFFLGAMTWSLRQTLTRSFGLSFLDGAPSFNIRVHEYEQKLFNNDNQELPVRLNKTQLKGIEDLYDQVVLSPGKPATSLPRPFVFKILDTKSTALRSQSLCMYDNAGEAFLPQASVVDSAATDHLGQASAILFLYDPTQDPRFRAACKGLADDPQMCTDEYGGKKQAAVLQDKVLQTAVERMRHLKQSRGAENTPLIVVITKADAWLRLLSDQAQAQIAEMPFGVQNEPEFGPTYFLDMNVIGSMSAEVKSVLSRYAPEVISAAEGLSRTVYYLPCSATGCGVTAISSGNATDTDVAYGIAPKDVKPFWCEVPLLVAQVAAGSGLIPTA